VNSTRVTRATVSSAPVQLVPADAVELDALVELFNDAYSDYVVPMRLDRSSLEFTVEVCDIDLDASRVVRADDGEPAAFSFLALRGDEGWIGGMGTAPARRRQGLGETALQAVVDAARDRAAASVRLEVIAENHSARALYEKLGFDHERDLVVWTLDSAPDGSFAAEPADPEEASAWIAANRPSPEPWQRADETRERMRGCGLEFAALALADDAGAVVYQTSVDTPRIANIAARDEHAAADLLAAVARLGGGFRFLNAPANEPASAACERLGCRPEIRQHEMRKSL
jgi:ribosomal protein S18 acetylase RimI-like enzyme